MKHQHSWLIPGRLKQEKQTFFSGTRTLKYKHRFILKNLVPLGLEKFQVNLVFLKTKIKKDVEIKKL